MADLCPIAVSEVSNSVEDQPQTQQDASRLLLQQMKYTDVVFTFPSLPDRIEAHELYLKGRSPVFEQMVRKRKSVNAHVRNVEIKESTPQRFQQFLEFIYMDKFEVNAAGALDLLQLAQKYQVHPLMTKCQELLKAEINKDNCFQIFETARRYERDDLVDRTGEIMAKSLRYLIKNDVLANAEEETLIYLLQRDDLYVKEVELFEFILKWGKKQVSKPADGDHVLQDKLKNIIPLIRFTNMTTYEFSVVVLPTRLLSSEDIISVYSYAAVDKAMRKGMNMKFNTTSRNKVAFVDFFSGPEFKTVSRERTKGRPLKLCISFQVEPSKNMSSNGGLKKPAITAIKVKLPSRTIYFSSARDVPIKFAVFIKECSEPVHSKNVILRFQKYVWKCEEGDEEIIPVKPAVILIPGVTYFIIVQDKPEHYNGEISADVKYVYSGKFSPYDLESKARVDLGSVDLQLKGIQRENGLSGLTQYDDNFAVNVIRGIKIDQV